jgi:hemerythrin-like metal-binding protein
MALIEWKDHYSVGVPAVDHEHRELIDLINRVHGDLCAGSSEARIADSLGDILVAISAHFALEEQFMREHRYDQREAHKAEHERLLDGLRDIMDHYDDDPQASSEVLAKRLDDWFTLHFRTHDARLHNRLGAHGHT